MGSNVSVIVSNSEAETQAIGARLAERLFLSRPAFVQLSGPLGAGKSAFGRGFIRRWSKLAGDPVPETIVSPTYNIVKVYGSNIPIAHFDLYRLKSVTELEQIGVEHYFYELPCCVVEWLEQVPEAFAMRPQYAVKVNLEMNAAPHERQITIEG